MIYIKQACGLCWYTLATAIKRFGMERFHGNERGSSRQVFRTRIPRFRWMGASVPSAVAQFMYSYRTCHLRIRNDTIYFTTPYSWWISPLKGDAVHRFEGSNLFPSSVIIPMPVEKIPLSFALENHVSRQASMTETSGTTSRGRTGRQATRWATAVWGHC